MDGGKLQILMNKISKPNDHERGTDAAERMFKKRCFAALRKTQPGKHGAAGNNFHHTYDVDPDELGKFI